MFCELLAFTDMRPNGNLDSAVHLVQQVVTLAGNSFVRSAREIVVYGALCAVDIR